MEAFIVKELGISYEIFNYLVLPFFIFLARVMDVSIATVRVMFIMNGAKRWAPVLGFFESMIWLLAIGQIMQNLTNGYSYLAYASGYATGTFIGMCIEEKIAMGKMIVRVITRSTADELIDWLNENGYRYTNLPAKDNGGNANVLFTVVKRSNLENLLKAVRYFHPEAFYTVESIKRVSDDDAPVAKSQKQVARLAGMVRR